jgi:hypothetical protein
MDYNHPEYIPLGDVFTEGAFSAFAEKTLL